MAAAPDLRALKRKKEPSCRETSSATAGWSSLPPDLVRLIADSFLATNDLDHYMHFRAVCPSWRAATDDPANNTSDPRFYARTWIILDEVFQRADDDDGLLLLNVATGHLLRRKRPVLRDYHAVPSTPSGFFVLAERSPPHAASLLNPLTGVLTRFLAPLPPEATVANVICTKDTLPNILLLSDSSREIYVANPDSECFAAKDFEQGVYNFFRKAVVGGAHSHVSASWFVDVGDALFNLLRSVHLDPVKVFSTDYPGDADGDWCFIVGLASDIVFFMKAYGTHFMFKVNTETGEVEFLKNISRFAFFLGHCRCLCVDASKFPGIEANCMYYTENLGLSARICKRNLKDGKEDIISEAAEFLKQDKQFVLIADRPFTIIHLLCSYTINMPDSQLALQQMS